MTKTRKKSTSWESQSILPLLKNQARKTGCDAVVRLLEAAFAQQLLDSYHVHTSHYDVHVFKSIAAVTASEQARVEIRLTEGGLADVCIRYSRSMGESSAFVWESRWIDDSDRALVHLQKCLAALDLLSEAEVDPDVLGFPHVMSRRNENPS